jgi:hypothetical protein
MKSLLCCMLFLRMFSTSGCDQASPINRYCNEIRTTVPMGHWNYSDGQGDWPCYNSAQVQILDAQCTWDLECGGYTGAIVNEVATITQCQLMCFGISTDFVTGMRIPFKATKGLLYPLPNYVSSGGSCSYQCTPSINGSCEVIINGNPGDKGVYDSYIELKYSLNKTLLVNIYSQFGAATTFCPYPDCDPKVTCAQTMGFHLATMDSGHSRGGRMSSIQTERYPEIEPVDTLKPLKIDHAGMHTLGGLTVTNLTWLRQEPNSNFVNPIPASWTFLFPIGYPSGMGQVECNQVLADPNFFKDASGMYARAVIRLDSPMLYNPDPNAYCFLKVGSYVGTSKYFDAPVQCKFQSYNPSTKDLTVLLGPIIPLLWETGGPYMRSIYPNGKYGPTTCISVKTNGCMKMEPLDSGTLIDVVNGWLSSVVVPGEYPIKGDLNLDGKINITDISLL